MITEDIAQPLVSVIEAQSFLRLDSGDEEALIAGFVRTASAICEQFVGHAIIVREFNEILPVCREWQRLQSFPVRSVTSVSGVGTDGSVQPLETASYAIDIDQEGRGWVRMASTGGYVQLEARGTAGHAKDANAVPEPLRHGVLRLVGHLFANRDGPGGEPPAAVTALWRPYRQMRLR